MDISNLIPKSWIKGLLVAAIGALAGFASKGLLAQTGKVIWEGNGIKIIVTQDVVDKGTNAVEIAKQWAIKKLGEQE